MHKTLDAGALRSRARVAKNLAKARAKAPTWPQGIAPFTPECIATLKAYQCTQCGHVKHERGGNHWGNTWSCGRWNTCPKCPPYAKYPEYGGGTVWQCLGISTSNIEG